MDEFNNRIDAQRVVLTIVNAKSNDEPLLGLSRKAIDRWAQVNHRPYGDEVTKLLIIISDKLLFLANRSQQQVTPEYQMKSSEINDLSKQLKDIWIR